MPRVNVEEIAFSDQRIELLGSLCGYNRFEALGRLAHLWRACTQRGTHVVSAAIVASCLGPQGPGAIVESELGEHVADGIRVRGTLGRVEWPEELSSKRADAGRKRVETATRDARGRLQSSKSSSTAPAHAGVAGPSKPATSSALYSSLSSPEDQNSLPRTISGVGSTEHTPASVSQPVTALPPEPSEQKANSALFREIQKRAWQLGSDETVKLRNEGVDVGAPNGWTGFRGSDDPVVVAFRDRLDSLLPRFGVEVEVLWPVVANRMLVAFAEGRAKRPPTGQFTTPARMWDPKSFAIAVDLSPEQTARAGPANARGRPDREPEERPPTNFRPRITGDPRTP